MHTRSESIEPWHFEAGNPTLEAPSWPRSTGVQDRSTIRDIIRRAVPHLHPVSDVPHLEAQVLLSHVLGISRSALVTHPEHTLSPDQRRNYQALIRRRAAGYPLPYLTGHAEFYGLAFKVTPEVLIPRPDTETLVDLALARRPGTIVDVGTGSGCIAISLALHLTEAMVYAIEISPAALAIAQQNAERHGVAERVQLMAGDVLSPRPGPVDLIVSNPPYIPTGQCASLPVSVRDHEPRLALDGGQDGLDVMRQLLMQAPAVLRPGGALLIEIGADQGKAAHRLASTLCPHAAIRVHPDLARRDRVLEVQT